MKKSISKDMLKNILLLLPFISYPNYILTGIFRDLFFIYSLLIYVYIYISYFTKKHGKVDFLIILSFILQVIPLMSTIILKNTNEIMMAIKVMASTIAILMLTEYKIKESPKTFLQSIYIFFSINIFINILTFFLYYPGMFGMNSFYFLGNDNGSIYETLVFFAIGIIYYDTFNNSKIPLLFVIFVLFISIGYFFVDSGNGKVCMLILLIFMFIYKNKKIQKLLNYKYLLLIYGILFALIVIFRSNDGIIPIILKILGKDPTYTGRTFIWDYCFEYINIHPIIGNGYESDILLMSKIHQVKAHNLIVQYLYMGGYSMIIFLITVIMISMKKAYDSMSNNGTIINFVLVVFLVISMFDYYYAKSSLFLLLALAYNCNLIKDTGDCNE